jgi:hypothetical protein
MRRSAAKKSATPARSAPDDAAELEEICSRLDAIIQRSGSIEVKLREIESRKRPRRTPAAPHAQPLRPVPSSDGLPVRASPAPVLNRKILPEPRSFEPPRDPRTSERDFSITRRNRTPAERSSPGTTDRAPFGRGISSGLRSADHPREFAHAIGRPSADRSPSPAIARVPEQSPAGARGWRESDRDAITHYDSSAERVAIKTEGRVELADIYRAILALQRQVAEVVATQREMRSELTALRRRSNTSF